MRPEGTFIAERLAAQHCAELMRGPRQTANPLAELGQFGARFAEVLMEKLAETFQGAAIDVTAAEPGELPANVNEPRGEPVFTTAFAAGLAETGFYASLPQGAALAMVDVALGGNGKNCEVGGKLPVSAQLMFERFEKQLTAALAEAIGLPGPDPVKVRKSAAAPEAALPFSGCKRTVLTVQVAVGSSPHYELVLTFSGSSLATLFAGRGDPATATAATAPKGGVVAPNAEPFAGIPLPLRAILVDMPIPVSALANLAPGTVITVAVARSVPLMVGDHVIAHGSVGAMDDRTALQLTRISLKKEN